MQIKWFIVILCFLEVAYGSEQFKVDSIQQLPEFVIKNTDSNKIINHYSNLFTVCFGIPDFVNIVYERYIGIVSFGINSGIMGYYMTKDNNGLFLPSLICAVNILKLSKIRKTCIHRVSIAPGLLLAGKYLTHDYKTKGFSIPIRYEYLYMRTNFVFKAGLGIMGFIFATMPDSNPWSEGSHGNGFLPSLSISFGYCN